MRTISCNICGRIGHSGAECSPGADAHTEDQYRDHMARISAIRRDWADGSISTGGKRHRIAAENKIYYRGSFKSPVTGEVITSPPRWHDEIASILADTAGVPLEAARAALDVRRRAGYHAAAYADSLAEARQILQSGATGYAQLLAQGRADDADGAAWAASIREAKGWPQPGTDDAPAQSRAIAALQVAESRRHRDNFTTGDTT